MERKEGPSLQEFTCEFVDVPPGTKARPRPLGRERNQLGNVPAGQDEYFELLALHRTIMEAKFSETGRLSEDLMGSPLLARAANRIVDRMIALEMSNGGQDPSEQSAVWRRLCPMRREWFIVERFIRDCQQWQSWTLEERNYFLDAVISPMTVSDEDRQTLLHITLHERLPA